MARLDEIVVGALVQHLLQPERLHTLLQSWLDRSEAAVAERRHELKRLRSRVTQLDYESANLIKLVRVAKMAPNDPQVVTEMGNIQAKHTAAQADIKVVERQLAQGDRRITPEVIDGFADLLRRKLTGSDDAVRKAYVRLLIDRSRWGTPGSVSAGLARCWRGPL